VRGKLSESNVGSNILNSYDWTSDKLGTGMKFSMDRIAQFIDDVDEQWLISLLDTIHDPSSEDQDYPSQLNGIFEGKFIWPVKSTHGVKLTSQFGSRWGRQHRGIDLSAKKGTPVYAVAPGRVIYASNSMQGFGNLVIIQHKGALSSYYAHNSSLKVNKGAVVQQGSRIALVGSTGRSTGPHLHFEIRQAKTAVNPCFHLPKHNMFSCKL
jgi:murein DD-endopeptidase MepM/ murein hydrolase activator NlpD